MTWSNRVVWLEGMFLRAQHFQQQDRWLEALVRDRTASLRPHGWGLTEAAINPNLLAAGELAGMLNQRGEALAARLTAPGSRGVADVSDFLLLQSVNRAQKLLAHWAGDGSVHPVDLYAALVQMAGDFATFTEASRRPSDYPPYRHADLQRSFAPVVADLRRSLSAVIEQTAIQIPLQKRAYGVQVGPIVDRGILRSSSFVLAVQADVPTETLLQLFPSQVKIGAVQHRRELLNVALPGITVRPLPVPPRQLPFYPGP